MSIISELKRRNVFRVAMAYVVVGWLLLQVSDILLDFAEAPAWVGKVIIALLAVGFVVAIVLAWLYEATPEGIRRDAGGGGVDLARVRRLDILTIIAATGVAAMFAWQQVRTPETTAPESTVVDTATESPGATAAVEPAINEASIAVLPFADLSPAGDQEYFTDGISEEILNVLAAIDGLAVASRTSSFAFKGQEGLGIPAIAEALEVRHVLEGSVRSAGSTIRITAQLIDADTDKHLWSQTFDRELSAENVFKIQDEIASAIVAELAESLDLADLGNNRVAIQADTRNLDAYQLFLQGRERFRVRSVSNIPGTIEVFQKAVELDPGFARAWAGLAAAAGVAPSWGIPGEDVDNFDLAEQAARRAIELDDSLALPYAVLANIAANHAPVDYGYTMEMYGEALKREPGNTSALLWRAIDLMGLGFFDEAIADLTLCHEIDPGYENCVVFESVARLFAGDYDRAMERFDIQAGNNSPSQSQALSLAMVAREDRRTAMLALAWFCEAFDILVKPRVIYQSLSDPEFDAAEAYQAFMAEQIALTGGPPVGISVGVLVPLTFRRYEDLQPRSTSMVWWYPFLEEFRASPHRKRLIREMGVYDYWRSHGFPPQCRPIGEDDFECD